jgi:UDP:flavonoid glycosyltransferase YjiC (YdhE family)
MHYGIVAIGSRGDVQPFVALALGLQQRGHQVTLLAHENFREFVEGYGLGFHPLFGNVEELLRSAEGQQILKAGNTISLLRYLRKSASKIQKNVNADLLAGARQPDALVTSLLGMEYVDAVAEKFGKKWMLIQLSFPTTPTKEFPFAGLDLADFPAFNLFSYWLPRAFFWRLNKKHLNEFRLSLHLPPIKNSIYKKISAARIPTLYAVSQALVPRPADWPAEIDTTGFIVLPAKNRQANKADLISDTLTTWLQAGKPPIYVGFGSMPIPDPEHFARVLRELLRTTNNRFVFCQGWSVMPDLQQSPNLYIVSSINHEWLLPQCKAAIIHGGVGTVAAALKACIPLVIVSIFADQPWWGKLIENKKLGTHLPFKKLTTKKLSAALALTLSSERTINAQTIGAAINREDGLAAAINTIEKYFKT